MIERFENFDLEKELAVRNRKARGFVPVALKADGSEVMIPVVMVIGKEDGPLVVSEGCAHGDIRFSEKENLDRMFVFADAALGRS